MGKQINWYRQHQKVQREVDELEREQYRDVTEAMAVETSFCKIVQTIKNYRALLGRGGKPNRDTLRQMNELEERTIGSMKRVSQFLLDEMNRKHGTQFSLDEIIDEQPGHYHQWGIVQRLEKSKKLTSLYHGILSDIIPKHPKDEHPGARSMKRRFFLHAGPTNSGKTHQSMEALKKAESGVFLAPLRLLALEVYERLNADGVFCDLATGEEEIRLPFSQHLSSTIEKARFDVPYDVAVIDEGQLLADEQRGHAWTRAILGIMAEEVHVCCAKNAVGMIKQLIDDCGDHVTVVDHERQTPLIVESTPFTFPDDVSEGDALIVFSRKKALQVASELMELDIPVSIIYGNLPPETRRKQVNRFLGKEATAVVSTDAIGMGLNLPIRRVVFLEVEKFDGKEKRPLTSQEVKQIAGRAGRRGMYEQGYVSVLGDEEDLRFIRSQLKKADTPVSAAYLSPLEHTITSMTIGTVEDRLKAWLLHKIRVPYMEKVDITEQFRLLERLNPRIKGELSDEHVYRAIHIPFNSYNDDLFRMWEDGLDRIAAHARSIPKPMAPSDDSLQELETYYRMIDLYYGFGKTFGVEMDREWIGDERERVSDCIHHLLLENTGLDKRTCRRCHIPLHWSFGYGICEKCYTQK